MNPAEPLGRNQTMKLILNKAEIDTQDQLFFALVRIKAEIIKTKLSEETLKRLKLLANEILYELQKELMNGQADSRIPHLSTRSEEERTSGSADRIEL